MKTLGLILFVSIIHLIKLRENIVFPGKVDKK